MTQATEKKLSALLGLCLRSGQMETGQETCVQCIRSQKAGVAFMDDSSSDNSQKRMVNTCQSHAVPLYGMSKGVLGHSIGREGCFTAVLHPGGLCDKILLLLQNETRLDADTNNTNAGGQWLP